MAATLNMTNPRDIEDVNKIVNLISDISEESKTMAIVYLSALSFSAEL